MRTAWTVQRSVFLAAKLHAEAALYKKEIGPHYPLEANLIATSAGLRRSDGKISDCAENRTLAVQPIYNNLTDRTSPVLITFLTGPVRF